MKINTLDMNNYKFPDHSINAVNKLVNFGIKTNIHFVLSSESIDLSLKILRNEDIFDGKIDLSKLNAIIFLLFKPQGNGTNHKELILSDDGIRQFRNCLKEAKTHFKIGIDSCLACRISSVCNDFTDQEKLFVDTCEGSRMSCYITSDMKFIPCSFEDHEKAIPIQPDFSIKNIWTYSKLFNDFRDKLKANPNQCPVEFKE